jgi:hypothetical protein
MRIRPDFDPLRATLPASQLVTSFPVDLLVCADRQGPGV